MITYRVGFLYHKVHTLSEAVELFNNKPSEHIIRLFIGGEHYGAIVRRMDPHTSKVDFIWKPEILFYLDILEIE